MAVGESAYQAFNARVGTVPAGTASVSATGTVDGQPVTVRVPASYAALTCG